MPSGDNQKKEEKVQKSDRINRLFPDMVCMVLPLANSNIFPDKSEYGNLLVSVRKKSKKLI